MKNGSRVRIRRRISSLLREEIRVRDDNNPPTPSIRKIRIAHKAIIPPSSEMVISVRCSDSGTFRMKPRSESHQKQRVLLSNGVINIQQDVPFTFMLDNFPSVPQRMHKNQIVGYAVPLDEEGIFPLQNLDLKDPPKHKEDNILHQLNEDDQRLTEVDLKKIVIKRPSPVMLEPTGSLGCHLACAMHLQLFRGRSRSSSPDPGERPVSCIWMMSSSFLNQLRSTSNMLMKYLKYFDKQACP